MKLFHSKLPAVERVLTGPRRAFWFGLLLLVLCALAYAGWYFTSGTRPDAEKGARPPGVPVRVQAVIKRDFPVYFYGLGNVIATNNVAVRSRVDGQLLRLTFTEGQFVKEGEMLAQIDPRPFEIQLALAEAQLMRDQALLANARKDLARYKVLLTQDSASPQQVDTQDSLVRQYEAAVKVDTANIASARLQLTYCRITAPFSGRLGLRLVDVGAMVRAGDSTGIVTITQVRPITVVFTVTEAQLPLVLKATRTGETLAVEAWDRTRSALLATGTLLTTDNQIDTATGTVKLKAIFDNEDDSLFPNQFVNARIKVATISDAVLAPSPAIQKGSRGFYVYVVTPEKRVAMRRVQTGDTDDVYTVVTEGVAPGDMVVIDGLDRLRDGIRVEVAPEATRRGQRGNGTADSPQGEGKTGGQRGDGKSGGQRGGKPGAQ